MTLGRHTTTYLLTTYCRGATSERHTTTYLLRTYLLLTAGGDFRSPASTTQSSDSGFRYALWGDTGFTQLLTGVNAIVALKPGVDYYERLSAPGLVATFGTIIPTVARQAIKEWHLTATVASNSGHNTISGSVSDLGLIARCPGAPYSTIGTPPLPPALPPQAPPSPLPPRIDLHLRRSCPGVLNTMQSGHHVNNYAFAALSLDGTPVAWGNAGGTGNKGQTW